MGYNEELSNRIRTALSNVPFVEEKKMFSGITFMVNGKMCISVSKDRIMCRIDPSIHEEAIKRKSVCTVIMKKHEYKGYVYVAQEGIESKEDVDYWIGLSLEFNKKLVVSSR